MSLRCFVIPGGMLLFPVLTYILAGQRRLSRAWFSFLIGAYYSLYMAVSGFLVMDLPRDRLILQSLVFLVVNFFIAVPISYLFYPIISKLVARHRSKS